MEKDRAERVANIAVAGAALPDRALAWIPPVMFRSKKKAGIKAGYVMIEFPDEFKAGVLNVLKTVAPILADLYGTRITPPSVDFNGKQVTTVEEFAAALYWPQQNLIEIKPGFYNSYLLEGKRFDGWVTQGTAHELSHAYIENHPKRRIDPNSPMAEGLSDLVGIYTAKMLRGESVDNASVASVAAKEAKLRANKALNDVGALRKALANPNNRITVEYALSVIQNATKLLENYAKSELHLADMLVHGSYPTFRDFVRRAVGTADAEFGAYKDDSESRRLASLNMLRGKSPDGRKKVLDAIDARAAQIEKDAKKVMNDSDDLLDKLSNVQVMKVKVRS